MKTLVALTDASPLWSDEIARHENPLLRSLMRYVQRVMTLISETGHSSSAPDDHGQRVPDEPDAQEDSWTDVLLLTLSILETVMENSVKGRHTFSALCESWRRLFLFHLLKAYGDHSALGNNCSDVCSSICSCSGTAPAVHLICRMLCTRVKATSQVSGTFVDQYLGLTNLTRAPGCKPNILRLCKSYHNLCYLRVARKPAECLSSAERRLKWPRGCVYSRERAPQPSQRSRENWYRYLSDV